MQQLRDATISLHKNDESADPAHCAKAMLDGMPPVMWFIRRHMRRHRTAGMSVPQYRALCVLEGNGPVSLSMLADLLGASQPTASRLVGGLVSRGYVARRTCSDDRRQCTLLLTPKGRARMDHAREVNQKALADQIAHLDPAVQSKIIETMHTLRDVFSPATR